MTTHRRTPLDRAREIHATARESTWREALYYLDAAAEVLQGLKAHSSNGEGSAAAGATMAIEAEAGKIRKRLGEVIPARDPSPAAGESRDDDLAARVAEERAQETESEAA